MNSWSETINSLELQLSLSSEVPDLEMVTHKGEKNNVFPLKNFNFPLFNYLSGQFPKHLKQYYLTIKDPSGLLAFAAIQLVDFSFFEYINIERFDKSERLRNLMRQFLYKPGKLFDGKILVLGHLLLSGVKASWTADRFPVSSKDKWWSKVMESVANNCFGGVDKFSALTIVANGNEIKSPEFGHINHWKSTDIYPIMALELRADWKDFNDYFNALRSRYKKKIRSVNSKSDFFQVRKFNLNDVRVHRDEIMSLFKSVLDSSSYTLLEPEASFFIELMQMDDLDYHINGVFHDGNLIAFYSWFNYDGVTEGHFLGYNKDYLYDYELYKFILIDLIEKTIETGSKSLVLGRTASIVKADLGAIAIPSKVLIRPVGFLRKLLFPLYYGYFYNSFSFRKRNVFH